MADWLRPVFYRTRSHNPQAGDRASSFSIEDNNEIEDTLPPRLKSSSRVSSYIGLARPPTPPSIILPSADPLSLIREPEIVYHKPSADHMAETLKVVMMNQNKLISVPVEYNSCILHVLEAYQDLRDELKKRSDEIEGLKEGHEKDIKEFEELATQWEFKEREYKVEIKKLEVQLSKTENGMEKVTLARTKSSVHGSKISESVGRRVSTIKERNAARSSRDSDIMREIPEFPYSQKDTQRMRSFESSSILEQNRLRDPFAVPELLDREIRIQSPSPIPRQQDSKGDLRYSISSVGPDNSPSRSTFADTPILTKLQQQVLQWQKGEQDPDMTFDSATSTMDSDAIEGDSTKGSVQISLDVDNVDNQDKSLLVIPKKAIPVPNKLTRHTMFDFPVTNYPQFITGPEEVPLPGLPSPPSQMGFSFQPGDDTGLFSHLPQHNSSDTTQKILATYLRHRSSTTSASHPETSSSNTDAVGRSNHAKSSQLEPQVQLTASSDHFDIETSLQDHGTFRRETSDSSIITAVRDNSGRSSVNVDGSKSQPRRQRLGRSSGSNEAVAAAQRALAGTAASKTKDRNKNLSKDKKSSDLSAYGPRGIKARGGSSGSSSGGREEEKESNSIKMLTRKGGRKAEKDAGKF